MNRILLSFTIVIFVALILAAGCTEQPDSNTALPPTVLPTSTLTLDPPPPEQTEEQKPVPTIFDQPVSKPPDDLTIVTSIRKDPVYSTITVRFDGGKGQDLIKALPVRTTLSTGEVIEQELGKNKGAELSIQGTRSSDRVQVAVILMNGDSYHLTDMMVEQNRVGLGEPIEPLETFSPLSEEGLYPGPVTEPPNSLSVSVSVQKEPIYRVITGTFRGGHGQFLISRIEMRALLSTGNLVTRDIAGDIGAIAEIQGTSKVDRVQVIVTFKNGETYKILEQALGSRG